MDRASILSLMRKATESKRVFLLQYGISRQALQVLTSNKDAQGRSIEVVKVPTPPPMYITKEEEAGMKVCTLALLSSVLFPQLLRLCMRLLVMEDKILIEEVENHKHALHNTGDVAFQILQIPV